MPGRNVTCRYMQDPGEGGSSNFDEDTRGQVQAYRPGSLEDFDRLYRASYSRILYTLVGMLGDLASAEDCAQDAFERAFRAWSDWRPEAPPEAWLHRIAVNTALSYRRWHRLRQVGELVRRLGHPALVRKPEDLDASSDLHRALRRLAPEQAAAIIMRHHHGYTNREIALALCVPESTVAWRLAAAKQRLRQELQGSADEASSDTSVTLASPSVLLDKPGKEA